MSAAAIEIAPSWDGRVDRRGGANACWPWTGPLSPSGYGQTQVRMMGRRRGAGAHQVAHYLATGQWEASAAGRMVRHLCHNPACCNPKHLAGGTAKDNARDRAARMRGEDLLTGTAARRARDATSRTSVASELPQNPYLLPVVGIANSPFSARDAQRGGRSLAPGQVAVVRASFVLPVVGIAR